MKQRWTGTEIRQGWEHRVVARKKQEYLVQMHLSVIFDPIMTTMKNTKFTKKHFPQEG